MSCLDLFGLQTCSAWYYCSDPHLVQTHKGSRSKRHSVADIGIGMMATVLAVLSCLEEHLIELVLGRTFDCRFSCTLEKVAGSALQRSQAILDATHHGAACFQEINVLNVG